MKETKEKIRQHLANITEDTAKRIGAAIGMKDYPTDVINALSEMRTDAEIECEKKKGKGNELWYWLTQATAACVQQKEKSETQKPLPSTGKTQPVFTQPAHDEEINVRIEALKEEISQRNLELKAAQAKITNLESVVRRSLSRADVAEEAGVKLSGRIAELQLAVESLTEQLNAKFHAVSDQQQYMVRTIKKAPRVFKYRKNADAAALSAASRNGLAEVFALVPVGKAVRGAVWREA